MDFEAVETDVTEALKKLPTELLGVLSTVILRHMPTLERVLPEIFTDLQPHLGAGMVEMSMGILDKEGLEGVMKRCLQKFQIEMPAETVIDVATAPRQLTEG